MDCCAIQAIHAALADAILHAIEHRELRATAASINAALVKNRADYQSVMPQAVGFLRGPHQTVRAVG